MPAGIANLTGAIMYQNLCLISPSDISREGLSSILRNEGFTIVGSFQSVADLRVESRCDPVVVVIDDHASAVLIDMIEQSLALLPSSIIVILAERFDLRSMIDCFGAGAQGYIIKSSRAEPMIAALRLAAVGERVLPPELVDVFDRQANVSLPMMDMASGSADAKLSQREDDVLCCLMAGYPNKVIARKLEVCEATVKVHVKAILRKLSVSNRTKAAIWANSRGYSMSSRAI